MKNVDNKPLMREEVAENKRPTQQNKNFVELRGGEYVRLAISVDFIRYGYAYEPLSGPVCLESTIACCSWLPNVCFMRFLWIIVHKRRSCCVTHEFLLVL